LLQLAVSVAIGSSAACLHWSTGRARAAGATKDDITGAVTERDYDLECTGAPGWWLPADVPVRSFLESGTASRVLNGKPVAAAVCCRRYWKHNLTTVQRPGAKRGGTFADGVHVRCQGGQVRSLVSLLSYLGTGEYRERYLGVKIPPAGIQEYHVEAARAFAGELADRAEVTQLGGSHR
jgi:hypothetical protein